MKLTDTMRNEYKTLWESMVVKDSWRSQVYRKAKQIYANKDKYEEIAALFPNGMPWYFIGIIHNLECGLDFSSIYTTETPSLVVLAVFQPAVLRHISVPLPLLRAPRMLLR